MNPSDNDGSPHWRVFLLLGTASVVIELSSLVLQITENVDVSAATVVAALTRYLLF
ncbi:hypothetical protein DFR71_6153 [Nocardia alba]|uniref:Low temperature requirement A protein (LtrA) n=1 Tax=Nocardia alba TaxID=225051 RepID=A0A4R1FAR5_9NOCA|nr:hypothetical protein DFR71_6153 [Nocardia alba]